MFTVVSMQVPSCVWSYGEESAGLRFLLGYLVSVKSGNTVEETPGVETLKMWAHKTNSYKPLEVSEEICQHYKSGQKYPLN